ncbi:MAG: hypothetical protein ABJA74_00450 [Lapillicoccus sp.]
MTEQPDPTAESRTDEGVPVGTADVEADVERASDDRPDEQDRDEFLQEGAVESTTDEGVPVGTADAEEDRRRAAEDG